MGTCSMRSSGAVCLPKRKAPSQWGPRWARGPCQAEGTKATETLLLYLSLPHPADRTSLDVGQLPRARHLLLVDRRIRVVGGPAVPFAEV